MKWPRRSLLTVFLLCAWICPLGQTQDLTYETDPFRQLDEILPTPTEVRLASGKPGPKYWQQRARLRHLCDAGRPASAIDR